MSLLDSFEDLMTKTADVYTVTTEIVNDVPTTSEELRGSYLCFFYRGSMSTTFVSDKFKDQVDGTFIFYPDFTIDQDKEYILFDGDKYKPVYPDNIGKQDEVIMLPVRKA